MDLEQRLRRNAPWLFGLLFGLVLVKEFSQPRFELIRVILKHEKHLASIRVPLPCLQQLFRIRQRFDGVIPRYVTEFDRHVYNQSGSNFFNSLASFLRASLAAAALIPLAGSMCLTK